MEDRISIGARLTQLAAQQPDKPAITDKDRTVTWGELERRANRLARGLAKAGV
jgi:bile acid-coenzyme A ligase